MKRCCRSAIKAIATSKPLSLPLVRSKKAATDPICGTQLCHRIPDKAPGLRDICISIEVSTAQAISGDCSGARCLSHANGAKAASVGVSKSELVKFDSTFCP